MALFFSCFSGEHSCFSGEHSIRLAALNDSGVAVAHSAIGVLTIPVILIAGTVLGWWAW